MTALHIVPRIRELGDGFQVRRALPSAQRRSVGPFVFFDQMGPVRLEPGHGLDVRPHPHIGLATVTYLFEGEILHRDSLGSVQPIRPGEVNWMTAGRGIVHSERTAPELRAAGPRLSGLQVWVGLPREDEETEPEFAHHEGLPVMEDNGVTVRCILGDVLGMSSPVATRSPTLYADISLTAGRRIALPSEPDERAIYIVEGIVEIAGRTYGVGEMLVFETGVEVLVASHTGARFMVFGGAPLDGPRFVWWNFVSSREDRIRQAAEDWRTGRFPAVPGETEFIPLPDKAPGVVSYP
ncbi:MAG TPA: pirin family protein [Usitatibacter sp.]|nr:pirin family protein [Usitatibacter sp.]